jgi:dipeptidyl aminopeptidase/acylaminoacyl peptidase
MEKDIRNAPLFREIETLVATLRRPGTGQISDAAEVHCSPDGKFAVFAGTLMDTLEGLPETRICTTDIATGDTRVLTFGPHTDRSPKFSPDGLHIAFLSDRHKAGDFQLYLLELASGAVRPTPRVDGWVEYLHWSPDGRRIVLGVAGHGADVAGGQGAVASKPLAQSLPGWMPLIETADASYRWRRAWIYEPANDSVRRVSRVDINVWEAVWCGDDALAAIVSPGPSEGLWYRACLQTIQVGSGEHREVYRPKDQIGWPAGSPSGKHLAVVEAVCSDRGIVAGDLRIVETATGKVERVNTKHVDIACAEWRSDRILLLAGHRGPETVVGCYDVTSGVFTETWASQETSTGGRYVGIAGLPGTGECVLVGEGFARAPQIAVVRQGEYRVVKSFDLGYADVPERAEVVRWSSSDGLEIQGWLLEPKGRAPHPLVMNVHGGPVWHWRPSWLGRGSLGLVSMLLLRHGYAVFLPNPRGSSGRGQDFARRVVGDMGGADLQDCLSGLDALIARGLADPKRLGVTGGSYGGFMTSWSITQDSRFAAAVSVAPVTNHVTEHLISNIPHFVQLFLEDDYRNPTGKYFTRSPVLHAHKTRTPTLNIAGALDRCTPAEEAVQFHNALLECGVESVLVIYPEEGHGVRRFPAVIDYVARVVEWFERHLCAGIKPADQPLSRVSLDPASQARPRRCALRAVAALHSGAA